MWISTPEGFVNTDHVLTARIMPHGSVELYPVVAGDWRGEGYPYAVPSSAAGHQRVLQLVRTWCDLGDSLYLNVNRLALVGFTNVGREDIRAHPYLAEFGKLSLEFKGEQARRIKDYLDRH